VLPSLPWPLLAISSCLQKKDRATSVSIEWLSEMSAMMIPTTYAYIGLTDLLNGEVRVLGLQLLVHSISEDDPAVHRARRLLDAGI
jgi:hypothetical protein